MWGTRKKMGKIRNSKEKNNSNVVLSLNVLIINPDIVIIFLLCVV